MTMFRLFPILLLAGCATRSEIQESQRYTELGDHQYAFVVIDREYKLQAAAGAEVDAELASVHRKAQIECLRLRAQQNIFQEREDQALVDLEQLRGLQADHPELEPLVKRAQLKKANRIATHGDEALMRKDYPLATALYMKALTVVADLAAARLGLDAVKGATSRMDQRAQEEFLDAVRKLPEFRFHEVQWHATNVLFNAPEREEAKELQARAKRANAEKAMARGKECERDRQFGAAMQEYLAAGKFDPQLPGLRESMAQMEKEIQATILVDKAQKSMRTGAFDLAREQLAQAFELSVMARNDIGELVQMTKKLEGDARYRAARDLEVLGKKSEALAAYENLVKDWPAGLSDEKARVENLRIDIDGAQKAWIDAEAAEAAGDQPKALEHYLDAERFYPGWKDGKARIARLRAVIAPPAVEGTPPPPATGTTPAGGTTPGNGG
jgi:hypothetical protein